MSMAQGQQQRQAAAGRPAASPDGQGAHFGQQLRQVVRPDLLLRLLAVDDHVRGAAVAAVVDEDAVAGGGDGPRQGLHRLLGGAAAGRERHPRPVLAQDFVADICAVDLRYRHGRPPQASTSTTMSISTGTFAGRLPAPAAVRACLPTSGPNTSTSRSEAPFITCGCCVKVGLAFTRPVTLTTRLTRSRLPTSARRLASMAMATSRASP